MPQWYDITRKPEYQSLTPEDQSTAKQEFFQRFILPKIDADEDLKGDEDVRKAAYYKFMQSPDDTGQGQITSTIGSAARGFGEIVPGAIQGAGALTGIKPLETAGEAVRSGLRYIAPVNPLYEDTILNKGANVVGNIGSVLATAGVGGAIGKGLAAERIAAGATAAEQALATTGAVTRGANAALYGSAGLQGAASGAQLADQYGLEGGARYANVLAGSLGEIGTELLPFGTIAETGAVKKLLTGAPVAGRAIGAPVSEFFEEGTNQLWQNAALKTLAPEGTETPGLTEGVLESAAYGGLGGGILAGVNVATGAYKQPANAAAAELLHAASLASPNTKLTTAATDKQIQDSVTATVSGLGEEAAAFAENLRRTQEEGEAADVQSAQMRAQEEAAQAQAAADRQAQFEGLSQNEPAITAPVGGAIPAVGQEETATIQPEIQLPDSLGVLEASRPQEDGQMPSPQVVGTTTTNSGATVPSNLTNSVGTVQFLSRDDPNRLLLEDGFAYRTVSEGEVNHFAQEGALLTDPNLAGQRKKSRGQTSQKMFSHSNPEHPEYGYRPNQLVIRVPINRIPIGTKGVAIRAQDAEVMRFDGEKWVGTPVSELPQPQAEAISPVTEMARQAAARMAGTEQGPNLNFPPVQPTVAEQPVERRYTVANVKTGKIVSRPDEPMTHKEAVTFRSKFSQPNNFTLVDVTNKQPISPQGAAPTGIATTTSQPMSGDSGKALKRFSDDLEMSGFAKLDGSDFKIKAGSDGTFYVERTTNGNRESISIGHPDIESARNAAIQFVSNPQSGNAESVASNQSNEDVGQERGKGNKVGNEGGGQPVENTGMSLEEAKKYLNRPGQILGFDEKSFLNSQRKTGTLSPAPTQETPSSPAAKLEKEGVVPASSSETEVGGRSNTPVETKETPQGEVSSADIESKALEILLQKRPNLSATVAAKAKKYFSTGDFDIIRSLPLPLRSDIDHSIQDADPKRLHAQLAADEKQREHDRKMEEDDRKADEEMAKRQAKLTESRRGTYDSIVGTPTGVEMNAVSEADGQEALAAVHNSGDVPGVLNAFVGTSDQFLSNPENETNFPDLWKILSAGRVDEGNFAYGRAFVFTDGIGVNASDRRNAARLGVTPSVAAVRRVLIHEGLVHRGIYGLPARLQMQILQWVKQNAKPEDLDALAKTYPQYADWATNPQQMLGLAEEFLAKNVEKMTRFPTNGPLARLVEILKDIWRYVTGKDGEPTVQNLRDIVKLLKAGAKAADARLVNGGGIKMSQLRAQGFVTPEMDAEYMAAVESGDVAKQQAMVDAAEEDAGFEKMFHGNTRERTGRVASTELGVHFGDEDAANARLEQTGQDEGMVNPYWVKIENPVVLKYDPAEWMPHQVVEALPKPVRDKLEESYEYDYTDIDNGELKLELQKQGFDGIKYPNAFEGGISYVAFEKSQFHESADPVTRDDSGNVIPLSQRFNPAKADIRESRISYANPLDAQLASASERMRQMREKQGAQEVETTLDDVKRIVNASLSRAEVETLLKELNTDEVKDVVRSIGYPTTGTKADNIKRILSFVGSRADAIAIRGENPTIRNSPTIVRTPEQQAAFDEERRLENERARELDISIPKKKPTYDQEEWNRNMAAIMAPSSVPPAQIRSEIRAAYDRAIQGSGSVQASIQQVFDEAKTQIPTLTERRFGEQLQALYEDGSAFLVPADRSDTMLAAGEKWGVYDASGMPASYVGIMPLEIRASRITNNIDIAIHSTRGITGKVDKIVNGLPANSYTGKPLQDAMSQSFAPLGSQQFYDETKSLIVKSIDDMIKRGVDSGDILATVIQPDFTEEAMKGWNESAKSVAKSIYFNHGLLLAVQKQEQLMNDGDITAANKQQDKIDAWSKFWFNLTNNFGVTGNAIQRAMEDPAYQGLYLLTNFAAQTQKAQKEVTDSNIANPNEVAKDINEVGAKSKTDADSDVADALTGIQVEDEIAAGEAALTPENRILWERAKAILRSLARIAKAETFFATKGIKASNAAESADEEVARYIQMGPKGVGALKAKLQKEFGSIVAKLTGTEKTGTARKPKTPKEETVHPLIARLIARTAAKLNAGTNLDAALADLMPETPSYRDKIVDDVVSGIVGRANRSIKKPKAPGVLADLTKQLKKILSENIKVETKSLPEESLAKKALRAFGYVASNEQLVREAWDKAREQVRATLRDGNLVETNETIEDKLNAILGEVPTQLYSTPQARAVIKDALKDTKFDNSKEILDDVKGARDMALKNINDAVEKEGNVDPARWQRDQSYILNAFDALVADLQNARDAGIAASNKAVRDAVFGADAQKALKIIIRKLTAARPGIDAPLAPALAWKRLFEMTQTDQGLLKGRMFDIVKDEPAFADLDNADKQKLADILEKSWDARRQQILTNELERLRIKHRNRLTKKAAKVFDNRPAILKKIDSGVFDYDDLAVLVGAEFGIKPLTAAENKRAKEISARLSEDISPHERTKLHDELLNLMVNKNLSIGEVLKSWWIASVLSGLRTAFTIGWSFLSGGYELMGHAAAVLLNNKMPFNERVDAVLDSIKNWWSRLSPEVRNAFLFVATGDKTLQDPAVLMRSSFFGDQFRSGMDRFAFSTAEKMITSKNPGIRALGWWMTYGGRILAALDGFNFNVTKAAAAPLVYSMLNDSYKANSFNTSKLFKTARKNIINNDFNGQVPTDASRLDAWARNAAYQELSKLTGMAENMNQIARQGNFTLEPTGFGGWLYSGLKFSDAFVQKKSEAFVTRMKQDLLKNGGSTFDKVLVGVAELVQAGAMQVMSILGLTFAKFALNKLNQTISFIPVAGFIRLKESGVEGQRVHEAMIWRNQAVGTLLFSFVYFTLKAIEDEPDDEKRGWGIEGGWSNLTPQEKRQRDAAGLKENTIWWRDKNGKRTVANFINWPISPILAAAGAMSDQIKYSPEQWQEGGVMKRGVTMGWAMGKSVSETSALSQFTELFGSSIASRDPVEAFANKAARVFGGYAGGYIPRIFKDIDRNMQPEIRKYEGWEYLGKELPYYRRYIGKEYLDIFGNVIAPSQTPWSREFVHQPDKPEYNMLSRVNSHGVWLSPAVAENRLVGKGSHKREMTNEEANRYVKIVGKGYSDLILKYGEKIISMPKDRAKKFVADKADDIRDRATKQAIQK